MAKPVRNSLGPLLLHHGCDRSLAELVLEGKTSPIPSENKYDWLGPGIYFWVDSPSRAMTWAREKQQKKPEEMAEPSVLGAFAYPGHCLNLTDYAGAGCGVGGARRDAVGIRNERRKQTYGNADALP